MTTRTCNICKRTYNGDESLCPHCYKRYMKGELPFDPIPEELEPFYDTGLEKLSIPFDFWQKCEKIRLETLEKLESSAAKRGSPGDQKAFRKMVNEQAKDRVREVIKENLPVLWNGHNLYESTNDDLGNYKIQF